MTEIPANRLYIVTGPDGCHGVAVTKIMVLFRVIPLNQKALEFVPQRVEMTEAEYVRLLYKLRGHDAPQGVLDGLSVEI